MEHKILIFGLTEAQRLRLEELLPTGFYLEEAGCVTDLIALDSVCSIVNTRALSKRGLSVLLSFYVEVGRPLEFQVVLLGKVPACLGKLFFCFDWFSGFLPQAEAILKKAWESYDCYRDYEVFMPNHAMEEAAEVDREMRDG